MRIIPLHPLSRGRTRYIDQTIYSQDIPEGGSKGTILLDVDQQDKARVSFEKYVDSILDLLISSNSPGIKEVIA